MKRAIVVLLCCLTTFIAGYSFRASASAPGLVAAGFPIAQQRKAEFTLSDIAKFEWVDKRCRMWAPDGDIDVDQTCLVGKTVRGGLVVFPNQFNDEWMKEMAKPKTPTDKWIQRFFAIGGGAK